MYTITNGDGVYKINFKQELMFNGRKETSAKDFREAVQALIYAQDNNSNYGRKVEVEYSEPSIIYSRKKSRTVKEAKVYFFIGNRTNQLCYSTTGKTGYTIDNMSFKNVINITMKDRAILAEEFEIQNEKRLNSLWNKFLKNKFDEITWSNLNRDSFLSSSGRIYDITKCNFPSWVYEGLKKAFKEKSNYKYNMDGIRRDFSVETRMDSDGIFRAWFSSEFAGTGNGDYYLLINPKIAVHYERD